MIPFSSLWHTAQPISVQSFHDLQSHTGMAADHIRPMVPATIGGQARKGLFMHPDAAASVELTVAPRQSLMVYAGLLDEVWEKNADGVLFSIVVTSQTSDEHRELVWHIDPHTNPQHRRWVPLQIDLSCFSGQSVRVTFSTNIPPNGTAAHAWSVWGSPVVLTRLTVRELWHKTIRHIRSEGVVPLLRRMTAAPLPDNDVDPYAAWIEQHALSADDQERMRQECATFSYQPTISILTPVYNVAPQWLEACVESVMQQLYPKWELVLVDDGSTQSETITALQNLADRDERITVIFQEQNQGIAATTNRALEVATGEFIGLLDNDDALSIDALYEVVAVLQNHRDADMIYSDEDKIETDGRRTEPFFKPDWSPEYFYSSMYTSHFGVYRKALADAVGGFHAEFNKAQDYDFVLRIIEQTSSERIHHIPKILYHWRKIPGSTAVLQSEKDMSDQPANRALQAALDRRGVKATVTQDPKTLYHRVKYDIQGEPLVSILLPTNGKNATLPDGREVNLLLQCLQSIQEKTTYKNYEIIIGHNGNLAPDVFAAVEKMTKETPQRVFLHHYQYEEPFNFANKLNFIARQAHGEYYLILNDDIEVITPEWMTALLEFAQLPEIGVVGAKLFYPDGRIQHAGVVMGIGGGASHVYTKQSHDDPGYFAGAKVIRNYSVVTGACAMVKAALFKELGGLDEKFRIDYNDVDFCLRLGAKGYRMVFTPYAQLTHHESVTLGSRAGKTASDEELLLRSRWEKVIANDPYYNPNLTLTDTNYAIRL